MKLNATYIKYVSKMVGLLRCSCLLLILPIFAHINTFAHISSGEVFLFYLPLALMISMMMFFSWAALPGSPLGFLSANMQSWVFTKRSLTANFIIIIILCWGGYRVFTPRRNNVSHGDTRLISQRIFWQIVFPATLFLILFQFAAFVGIAGEQRKSGRCHAFNLDFNHYQALLVGNLIRCPACYFIIRVVRNPFYLRSYYSQLKQQVDAKVTKRVRALATGIRCFIVAVMHAVK